MYAGAQSLRNRWRRIFSVRASLQETQAISATKSTGEGLEWFPDGRNPNSTAKGPSTCFTPSPSF
jgi:hypothetical protein